jgi:hypothetical protein
MDLCAQNLFFSVLSLFIAFNWQQRRRTIAKLERQRCPMVTVAFLFFSDSGTFLCVFAQLSALARLINGLRESLFKHP